MSQTFKEAGTDVLTTTRPPEPLAPAAPTVVGKTIRSLKTYAVASTSVIELLGTDGVHYFIKVRQGVFEIGGTKDWGTGRQSE
jgi:hypothetical protein